MAWLALVHPRAPAPDHITWILVIAGAFLMLIGGSRKIRKDDDD